MCGVGVGVGGAALLTEVQFIINGSKKKNGGGGWGGGGEGGTH